MANIISFPEPDVRRPAERQSIAAPGSATPGKLRRIGCTFGRALWMIFAAFWPLVKFAFTLDLLWQLGRMIWFWDRPEAHAGWTFTLHFLAFSFCFYVLASYRPKGWET